MPKKNIKARIVKKQNCIKISGFIFLILSLLFFLFFAFTHLSVYIDSASNKCLQYMGTYDVRRIHTHRNVIYLFLLENGDSVVLKPELLQEHRVDAFPSQLQFSYSSHKTDFFHSAYTAIEIIGNENEVLLRKEDSMTEAKMGAITGGLFTTLILACIFLCIGICKAESSL